MRTIDWYMDEARRVSKLSSDRKLSVALGIKPTSPNYWRAKKAWPSEESMVALAELAGVAPTAALLDLAIWRAKDEKVSQVWKQLLKAATTLALPLMLSVAPVNQAKAAVRAEVSSSHTVYYEKYGGCFICDFTRFWLAVRKRRVDG